MAPRLGNLGQEVLSRNIRKQDPTVTFLMETKLETTEMKQICEKLGYSNFYIVDCDKSHGGRRGGLCLMWKESINLQVQLANPHVIDTVISIPHTQSKWRLSGIYGWPEDSQKCHTWQLIRDIRGNNNTPWLCMGDFNEILYHSEKVGGRLKEDSKLKAFQDVLSECNLDDLGFEGYNFTWTNGQEGDKNIQERLDRCVANMEWVSLYPAYKIEHHARILSDHCPLTITWNDQARKKQRKRLRVFRFEKMWLQDESCRPFVQNAWMNQDHWERAHFGSITKQLEQTRTQIGKIQNMPPTATNINATKSLEKKLLTLLKRRRLCGIKDHVPIGYETETKYDFLSSSC
ncbi:hypothetical protein DH2020_017211 [Rehmannia glutinosa]|uniref:Endonuclease/exonuclease/phosphatase domain-containing protein n=1 Tax=Rehmannia glutinosa TaxID=99300 RepID=A0ABR0WSX5_REHGL